MSDRVGLRFLQDIEKYHRLSNLALDTMTLENFQHNEYQPQAEQAARQELATMGSMQSIRDANALLASQQAQATAGQQATGGGFDFNKSREEALANLGAASGMLPTTYSNAPTTSVNPALAGLVNQGAGAAAKKANMFSLPSSSDLKFGGV